MTAVVRWSMDVTDAAGDMTVTGLPADPGVYVAVATLVMIVPEGVIDQPTDENR
jgi:hypothetical protein